VRPATADRLDADRLSELLRLGSLKPVYHGASGLLTLKELVRSYVNLVEDGTRMMLRIKALFRARGIKTPGTSVCWQSTRKSWCRNSSSGERGSEQKRCSPSSMCCRNWAEGEGGDDRRGPPAAWMEDPAVRAVPRAGACGRDPGDDGQAVAVPHEETGVAVRRAWLSSRGRVRVRSSPMEICAGERGHRSRVPDGRHLRPVARWPSPRSVPSPPFVPSLARSGCTPQSSTGAHPPQIVNRLVLHRSRSFLFPGTRRPFTVAGRGALSTCVRPPTKKYHGCTLPPPPPLRPTQVRCAVRYTSAQNTPRSPMFGAFDPVTGSTILSAVAAGVSAVTSVIAIALTYHAFRNTIRAAARPVLVFNLTSDIVWQVKNVGTGPAIAVTIGDKWLNSEWSTVVRCHALGAGDSAALPWVHEGAELAVVYKDVFNKYYTTNCTDGFNEAVRGNKFKKWQPTSTEWELEIVQNRSVLLYSEEYLRGKTPFELDVLRNEFYARKGYRFKRKDLFDHFSRQPWYQPTTSDQTSVNRQLTQEERYTALSILFYQNRNGLRVKPQA
jgi:hypothetical protein